MRTELVLSVGILLLGIGVESSLRWGNAGTESSDPEPNTSPIKTNSQTNSQTNWLAALPEATITRKGRLPQVKHDAPTTTSDPCGMQIAARHLTNFSTTALVESRLNGSPPLVVMVDGAPLLHNGKPGTDCSGQFAFEKNTVVFSPGEGIGADATYRLGFQEQFPLTAPDGPVWWVFSGTRAEASFAESAGLVGTELTARIVATRLPGNPPLEATFSVAGTEKTLRDQDGTLVGSIRFTVPEGAWAVTVDSPRGGGPHLLLASLTLSDGHQRTDLLMEGN